MDRQELTDFLLNARTETYAGGGGSVEAQFSGSTQLEHSEGSWFYRDIYYLGNEVFPGLETVYYQDEPVWSMSYFGDFKKMTEEQADTMLRKALIDNWQTARIYKMVEKDYNNFKYICNGQGSIDELSGTEEIYVDGEKVYFFNYNGGFIG